MAKSKIEWTEVTWNPTTGCTKVSEGCKNCYAERLSFRLKNMGNPKYRNGFNLTIHPETLSEPYKWKKSRKVFVNSMSDLFHEGIDDLYIREVFRVMRENPKHIFQVLTKRTERLFDMKDQLEWADNIWIGATVESVSHQDRIKQLRSVPAAIKFLSCEPLLSSLVESDFSGIDWVIVGGESGPGSRPMEKQWVEEILGKCYELEIPIFFKQWGKKSNNPNLHDPTIYKGHVYYAKGGCQFDGELYQNFPTNG